MPGGRRLDALRRRSRRGRPPLAVADPLAPRFSHIAAQAGRDPAALARGFLSLREVFGDDLSSDRRFVAETTAWLEILLERGARAAVAQAAEI